MLQRQLSHLSGRKPKPLRITLNSLYCFLYRLGTDHAQKTPIVLHVFILGDCLATNRNIRYDNGLPIVVMPILGEGVYQAVA
jgi:hypothetical protein